MALLTYDDLVANVRRHGHKVSPRGEATVELANLSLSLSPGQFVRRSGMNLKLAFVEALMLVGGIFDLRTIESAAPNADLKLFAKQSDYGVRVRQQVPLVIDELRKDPSSRRAAIQYNGTLDTGSDNIACTMTSQYLLRSHCFYSTYTMRSWDLVYGFPNDIIMFGFLTRVIQRCLGLDEFETSLMTVNAMSAHIYEKTSGKAVSGPQNTYLFELDEENWPRDWDASRALAANLAYNHFEWGGLWPTDYVKVFQIDPHFLILG